MNFLDSPASDNNNFNQYHQGNPYTTPPGCKSKKIHNSQGHTVTKIIMTTYTARMKNSNPTNPHEKEGSVYRFGEKRIDTSSYRVSLLGLSSPEQTKALKKLSQKINDTSSSQYIGFTQQEDPKKRLHQHCYQAVKGKNGLFYDYLREEDTVAKVLFAQVVVEKIPPGKKRKTERKMIELCGPTHNSSKGGEGIRWDKKPGIVKPSKMKTKATLAHYNRNLIPIKGSHNRYSRKKTRFGNVTLRQFIQCKQSFYE